MKGSNHKTRFMLKDMDDHKLRTVAMILVNFTTPILKSLQSALWRLLTLLTTSVVNGHVFFFPLSSKIKEGNEKQKSMSMKLLNFPI